MNPYKTGPTESPTKIISAYLSAIFAIGAVYDVIQIIGTLFLNFSIIFFFFSKTLANYFYTISIRFFKITHFMTIKRIKNFLVIFLLCTIQSYSLADDAYIDPEPYISDSNYNNKYYEGSNIIVVTANDYATRIGYDILRDGGTVFDAAVSIQLALGLVEPQSSGLGGGLFAIFLTVVQRKL